LTRRKAELDTMTTSDLTTLMKEKMAEEIETKVREKRVGRNLLREDTTLLNRPGNTLKFKKRGTLQATQAGENEEADFQRFTQEEGKGYQSILTVEVNKFRVASELSTEMIQDGEEDAIEATEEEIAAAMSDLEDIVCIGAAAGGEWHEETKNIDGTTSDIDLDENDNTFAIAYIKAEEDIDVGNVDVDEGEFISLSDLHEINYGDANVVFQDGDEGDGEEVTVGWVGIDDVFIDDDSTEIGSITDINTLRTEIASNKYDPDTLIVNQANLGDIMDLEQFHDVSKFGNRDVIRDGQVGRILGMDVILSSQLPDEYVVALDAEAEPSVLVNKENLRVQQEGDISSDSLKIVAYQRFGVGCLREDAVYSLQLEE